MQRRTITDSGMRSNIQRAQGVLDFILAAQPAIADPDVRGAILFSLVDLGNQLNNGEYATFTPEVIATNPQIPWTRIREIRNNIIHHPYNPIASELFDISFFQQIAALRATVQLIVLTSAAASSVHPLHSSGTTYNFLQPLHDAIAPNHNEIFFGDFHHILFMLDDHLATIKLLLASQHSSTLENTKRPMIRKAIELEVLITGELFRELANRHINILIAAFREQRAEMVAQIMQLQNQRDISAHSLALPKNDNSISSKASKYCQLHEGILDCILLQGHNVIAILAAREAFLLRYRNQAPVPPAVVTDVRHCLALITMFRQNAQILINQEYIGYMLKLACPVGLLQRESEQSYERIFNDHLQQLRIHIGNQNTPEHQEAWQRATHLVMQPGRYPPPHLVGAQMPRMLEIVCQERAVILANQQNPNALIPICQSWPLRCLERAVEESVRHRLNYLSIVVLLTETQRMAQVQAQTFSPGINISPLDLNNFIDTAQRRIFVNAYISVLHGFPSDAWLTALVQHETPATLRQLEINPMPFLMRLETLCNHYNGASASVAASASAAISASAAASASAAVSASVAASASVVASVSAAASASVAASASSNAESKSSTGKRAASPGSGSTTHIVQSMSREDTRTIPARVLKPRAVSPQLEPGDIAQSSAKPAAAVNVESTETTAPGATKTQEDNATREAQSGQTSSEGVGSNIRKPS